ncbi:unnamed protein product [Adineta steineri]|uniref:DUF4386 domain-containing protein n=1 Tax=Adineta steineri TaxID=433720 RepID=A0A816CMH1_9BILA|nr:unnamed protein product [Adineta steineri]CAF1624562.1 unnamed protein product [Adineta steineri]
MVGISQRKAALIAGFSILIMAILAGFAYGFVLQDLIVPDNTTLTADNIRSSLMLFRLGIFSFLIILICDVLAAWALHVFLKQVNEHLSLLTAWFRLIYSAILGTALLNLVFVALLLNGANYLSIFEISQLNALVTFFLNGFHNIWSIGLVIFGCHLYVLGYLVLKSRYIPKILGFLLIIASLCYIINNSANLLLSNYEKYKLTVEVFIGLPMICSETGLGAWLLYGGGIGPED